MGPALAFATLMLIAAGLVPAGAAETAPPPGPRFVGRAVCAECHQTESKRWHGSDHDLAMQEASAETVLGDFADAEFTHFGVTSRFFRRDGGYYVRTEGPDGKAHDYRIAYTFGVRPLQQYLIEFPGGRFQVLGIAWDTRPKDAGGQRWFHLYSDERIDPSDPLFWTGINQNWNYMCADCHSTNVRRNYSLNQRRYQTTLSELDVSCEACHGPGSRHVAWAGDHSAKAYGEDKGLVVSLPPGGSWSFAGKAPTASRSEAPLGRTEIETCGRCHARRSPLDDGYRHGRPVLDSYRVALLSEDVYHADGQIDGEVYVYGSFLQSKMYAAGVTCSDCHDAHSTRLKASGNALCTRCHRAETFDTTQHHAHQPGTPGGRCVDCHMPEKTYTVVDPRRDHSFRIPRPDLSMKIGVPNACTGCHDDQTDAWAAARIAEKDGGKSARRPHFGEAIAAGRRGEAGWAQLLIAVAGEAAQPGIARATALELLGRRPDPAAFAAIREGLGADDPLIRLAAVEALAEIPAEPRFRAAFSLLRDPVRAVRFAAAQQLALVPEEALPAAERGVFVAALAEYEKAAKTLLDRPEGLLNLGNFYRDRRADQKAGAAYQAAIQLYPRFAPAYANLADLYRAKNEDDKAEQVLRQGLASTPEDGDLHYALGLLRIRQKRYEDATTELGRAAALRRDRPRYAYLHALALEKTGKRRQARMVLEAAHARAPNDADVLFALATMSKAEGDPKSARRYARKLAALTPRDPRVIRLLRALRIRND